MAEAHPPHIPKPTAEQVQGDITRLLEQVNAGQTQAHERLYARVYEELHRIATGEMGKENAGHLLQTTALVNETYMRLCGPGQGAWQNRRHFFGAAARAMRRILIDNARQERALKRGGALKRVNLDGVAPAATTADGHDRAIDLEEIDMAISALEVADKRKAEMVILRFYGGLTNEEIARIMDVSPRSVTNDWAFAKVWLYRWLDERRQARDRSEDR